MDNNRHIRLRLKGNVRRGKAEVDDYRQSKSPGRGRVAAQRRGGSYLKTAPHPSARFARVHPPRFAGRD